jgi:hypothetical protein
LCHFLATLAYRTQKALRDAPEDFGDFQAGAGVRSPHELLQHMSAVLSFAVRLYDPDAPEPQRLGTFDAEVRRFHALLDQLARHLESSTAAPTTPEKLLQGPLSDAMTHAGQLAMLRRLFGSPIAGESFIKADIRTQDRSIDQPPPAAPLDR